MAEAVRCLHCDDCGTTTPHSRRLAPALRNGAIIAVLGLAPSLLFEAPYRGLSALSVLVALGLAFLWMSRGEPPPWLCERCRWRGYHASAKRRQVRKETWRREVLIT